MSCHWYAGPAGVVAEAVIEASRCLAVVLVFCSQNVLSIFLKMSSLRRMSILRLFRRVVLDVQSP